MITRADEVKRVDKPWGYELWVANSSLYCGKLLHFNDGRKCSWHYHNQKDETFYVVNGCILIRYSLGDNVDNAHFDYLYPGDTFHVQRGLRHQMQAFSGDAEIFETSTEHFDSDSIRV